MSTNTERVEFAEAIVPVLDGPEHGPIEREGLDGRVRRLAVRATLSVEPPRLDVTPYVQVIDSEAQPGAVVGTPDNDAYRVAIDTNDNGTVSIEVEGATVRDGDKLRHPASPDAAMTAVGDLCASLGVDYQLWPPAGSEPVRLDVSPELRDLSVDGESGRSSMFHEVSTGALVLAAVPAALEVLRSQPAGFQPEAGSFNPVQPPAAA